METIRSEVGLLFPDYTLRKGVLYKNKMNYLAIIACRTLFGSIYYIHSKKKRFIIELCCNASIRNLFVKRCSIQKHLCFQNEPFQHQGCSAWNHFLLTGRVSNTAKVQYRTPDSNTEPISNHFFRV